MEDVALVRHRSPQSHAPRIGLMLGALLPLAIAVAPATAQSYAARDVGGWTVAVSNDGKGCFITRTYDRAGNTTLLLGLDLDGANHLSVLNDNWSIKPQDRLKLSYSLSNGSYPDHFAVGMASEGKPGFVSSFEPKFPTYFAASSFLHIDRGDTPVEQLALSGSGAAVTELRRCVELQRARPAASAAAKDPAGAIPRDPFATPAKRKPRK